ncbi:MAG: hypothetical protein HGA39_08720 [Coriobacteriia bacterium]|nr:hypothetical protein [Coriobacteriia bacterium]
MATKRVLFSVLVICCALALAGCGTKAQVNGQNINLPDPSAVVNSAKEQASAIACTAIRQEIDKKYIVPVAGATAEVSFGTVLKSIGKACPSGGTYTFDDATKKTRCSVHGE